MSLLLNKKIERISTQAVAVESMDEPRVERTENEKRGMRRREG